MNRSALTPPRPKWPTDADYDDEFDAYYNPRTGEWLEEKCSDPTCRFCPGRPELAPRSIASLRNQIERLNFALNFLRLPLKIDPSIDNADTEKLLAAFNAALIREGFIVPAMSKEEAKAAWDKLGELEAEHPGLTNLPPLKYPPS